MFLVDLKTIIQKNMKHSDYRRFLFKLRILKQHDL